MAENETVTKAGEMGEKKKKKNLWHGKQMILLLLSWTQITPSSVAGEEMRLMGGGCYSKGCWREMI